MAPIWVLRLALSGLFLYAGSAKMRETQGFAESVASFRLLPEWMIMPAAFALPPLEIMAAVMALMIGRARRVGAFCLFALLVLFTVALASALARGLQVDCGCLGADRFDVLSPSRNLWNALWRDLVLGIVAGFLYADARRRQQKPDQP